MTIDAAARADLEHLGDICTYHAALFQLRAITEEGNPAQEDRVFETMARVAEIHDRLERREAANADLSATRLRERFALSKTELHCLWLLTAIAIEPALRAAMRQLSAETAVDPTLGAIKVVIYGYGPSREALLELAPGSTLRRFGLIERSDGGSPDVHEARRTWSISARVLAWLHGARDPLASEYRIRTSVAPTAGLQVSDSALASLRHALSTPSAIVLITGSPGFGRRTLAWAVAQELGIGLLEVDIATLPRELPSFTTALRQLALESVLSKRAPLLANLDSLGEIDERARLVADVLLPLMDGLVVMTSGSVPPVLDWRRASIRIALPHPTGRQSAELWHAALGQGTREDADLLATMVPLAPALIYRAAASALIAARGGALEMHHILEGIRTVTATSLARYATRLEVTQTWDDIVLAEEQADAVEGLIRRVRGRRKVYEDWGFAAKVGKGLGVSALFSGPPGTGKTMVASLIAKDLGAELYQVDISRIVSKYIGETEENLAALFDAADATHAILLFDEADALFGKRTEVRSSNDRNANLETNFLLQRLESFQGVCLLTTNHESHLDPAFQRRIALHVRFTMPEAWEREHLWRAVLPADAPLALEMSLGDLAARYAMSGGYIKNAALRAAFLAAHDNAPISMAHLEKSARLEYEAMGKLASAG